MAKHSLLKKALFKNVHKDMNDSFSLSKIISAVMKRPDSKVDRDAFLREEFKDCPQEIIEEIVRNGPVKAGCQREDLRKRAMDNLADKISSQNVPEDKVAEDEKERNLPKEIIEFYSVALKSAQEIAYLYGEGYLWKIGGVDSKEVKNQLVLYCAVMLGATGASKAVKVFAVSLTKDLRRKMLSKIVYFPLIKTASKVFGKDVTFKSFSKNVSEKIPVAGELISEEITNASLLPMGNRLIDALDKAHFDYSEEELESDIKEITEEN